MRHINGVKHNGVEYKQANQGQLSAAVEDFRHALDLDPGSRNAAAYLEAVEGRLREKQVLDTQQGSKGCPSEVPSAAKEGTPRESRPDSRHGATVSAMHHPLSQNPSASMGGSGARAPENATGAASGLKRSKDDDDSSKSGHSSSGEGPSAYCDSAFILSFFAADNHKHHLLPHQVRTPVAEAAVSRRLRARM